MSQHSVRYDMLGNITSKDDVGTYTYGAGAGPHAVTSIAGPNAGSFLYDQNGNMKEGNGRTLEWTSFNMPASITKGNVSIGFSYGPEHQRIKQTKPGETIYYFAGGVELVVNTASNLRTWTNYVSADGRLVGSLTRASTDALNASIPAYYHLDHLGSLDRITDQWGTVIEKLDFDAWGKRRWANGSDDAQGLIPPSSARRGFTGHEQLDNVGLVHMNGRIYDPVIARFLSADPTVQAPYNLQSFNRYSYVQNNPLSYTDPTGFSIFSNLIKGITNFLVGLVKSAIKRLTSLDYWLDVLETAAYAINPALGVAFSAIRGAITTGSLDGTIKYTLMSAFQHASAFMGAGGGSFSGDPSAGGGAGWKGSGGGFGSEWLPDIMGKWLPDAAAAGFSLADGAKDYKANLASAGAGQLGGFGGAAGPLFQFARAKANGGTATALGNAKFANGAGTGSYRYVNASTSYAKEWGVQGAAAGAAAGGIVGGMGGVGAAMACAGSSGGVCAAAAPIIVTEGISGGAAAGGIAGGFIGWVAGSIADSIYGTPDGNGWANEADRPPPGSKGINETPWSGNHGEIKQGVGAPPDGKVRISPDGNVWVEGVDGKWSEHGPASDYVGSGKPNGRKGRDRRR